uniref:Nucleosome assembly protein n=2 Tax=Strongyloides stercoralis TaxID=6248 RepID=A0AAF5D7N2_STRER
VNGNVTMSFPHIGDELSNIPLYIEKAPSNQRRIVQALKKNQKEIFLAEVEFYRKILQLQIEHQNNVNKILDVRAAIINGDKEVSDADCTEEAISNLSAEDQEKIFHGPPTSDKGIKGFWLHVLQGFTETSERILEKDEPILEQLKDIKLNLFNNGESDQGFTLTFVFGDNEFFEEKELVKTYKTSYHPEEGEEFWLYDGNHIVSVESSKITWKPGKSPLVGRQGKDSSLEETSSFFDYFMVAININECADDEDKETAFVDFELGQLFRDEVVPRATLMYTGEYIGDENLDMYEDDEEEESDDDEEN